MIESMLITITLIVKLLLSPPIPFDNGRYMMPGPAGAALGEAVGSIGTDSGGPGGRDDDDEKKKRKKKQEDNGKKKPKTKALPNGGTGAVEDAAKQRISKALRRGRRGQILADVTEEDKQQALFGGRPGGRKTLSGII